MLNLSGLRPALVSEAKSVAPTVAIIGGGFSGTLVAAQLLHQAAQPLQIVLIEPRSQPGQGLAYSTPLNCHLLNVPAGKLSAFPEDPQHFCRWLAKAAPDNRPVTAQTFAPRKLYGQYVQDVLVNAEAIAPPQVSLRHLRAAALQLRAEVQGYTLQLSSGDWLQADGVVLAIGNLPPAPLPVADSSFYHSDRYIASPWQGDRLAQLSPKAPVLLVGSGLTAVDALLSLRHYGHTGIIHLLSRRGLRPQAHALADFGTAGCCPVHLAVTAGVEMSGAICTPFSWDQLQPYATSLSRLTRCIRQQIHRVEAEGGSWQSVIDGLRPQTQRLWQALPLAEKQRFLRHLRPYWDTHRHRMAPAIAHQFNAELQSNRTCQWSGRLLNLQLADASGRAEAVEATVRLRGGSGDRTLSVQAVINCTGPSFSHGLSHHPLLIHLIQTGLACSDRLRLGLTTAADGLVIGTTGLASTGLYALGGLRQGQLWESTAIPEIRDQAAALAAALLQHLILRQRSPTAAEKSLRIIESSYSTAQ